MQGDTLRVWSWNWEISTLQFSLESEPSPPHRKKSFYENLIFYFSLSQWALSFLHAIHCSTMHHQQKPIFKSNVCFSTSRCALVMKHKRLSIVFKCSCRRACMIKLIIFHNRSYVSGQPCGINYKRENSQTCAKHWRVWKASVREVS
jgi:hypothetical protein